MAADKPLFPLDPVLVEQDRLDKAVYGVCAFSGYPGTMDGFHLGDMTWNHSTHQAEYELAEAHYYLVWQTFDASNPLVMAVVDQIISGRMQSLAVTADDF